MRFNILSAISFLLAVAAAGCADEELTYPGQNGDEATGASPLRFEVTPFAVCAGDSASRASEPSAIPEPESEEERRIRDFWLFQFKTDGSRLADPKYYSIPTDGATLDDLTQKAYTNLTKNTAMTIYVVTNTGDAAWGSGFNSLTDVKDAALPSPFPIQAGIDNDNDGKADDNIYIPMSGQADNVTVTDKSFIEIPVTRAYAKVKIQAGFPKDKSMNLYYANVEGIPWYCKAGSLAEDTEASDQPNAVAFPDGTRMISRAFNSKEAVSDADGTKWLVLYMPENIRGEVSDADKKTSKNIPKDALTVTVRAKYDGADYYYKVYPGENIRNNFNIRRNRVYRVMVDVRKITDQHNPSSNCFVVKPGEKLSFEPYNRVEKGGGYDISTYLDPNDSDKRIKYTKIIWQTEDCIGDNSDGKLVHFEPNEQNPANSKIIIEKVGLVEGNALIGAYNSKDQIIWSWHIWVTPNEPDNIANAVIYTTYPWDASGIHADRRVPGYGIMPCNIGALAFRSEDDMPYLNEWRYYYTIQPHYSIPKGEKFPDSQIRTFGMLYQWGRKDPFPPMICSTGVEDDNSTLGYTNDSTEKHYANNNTTIVNKSSSTYIDTSAYLFHSEDSDDARTVQYSINHPTIYIIGNGTNKDWCKTSNDRLWGAASASTMEYTIPKSSNKAHLRNNYGTKSIFDPCPAGWRVPPGDLWLGFTSTGLNPTNYEEQVNYSQDESGKRPGMSMFVQKWHDGPTIYFPLQGTRINSGVCQNTGLCGNYHNATCDDDGRVNLLHLHRNMAKASKNLGGVMLFKLFEFDTANYYAKSTAGPIRCVRDSK